MEYYDLHVRFPFEKFGEAGFSRICVWNRDIEEFEDHKHGEKLLLLQSNDPDYIKPRIKRASLINDPDYKLDMGIVRAAAKYGKVFEIPVRPVLTSSGIERAMLMKRMSRFLELCSKLGADYAITSRARDQYETKHPAELISVGCALGLTYDQALRAITEVPKSIMRTRV